MRTASSTSLRTAGRLAAAAAFLLLAGVGCPTMTAPVEGNNFEKPTTESTAPATRPSGTGAIWFFTQEPKASFAHVQPGVRSEIYVDFRTGPATEQLGDPNQPATMIDATLTGPGVLGDAHEAKPFEFGQDIRFTWSINRFGDYTVDGDILDGTRSVRHFTEKLKVK